MEPTPVQSFLRFLFGFFLFIGLSLSLTVAVNTYTTQQMAAAQQAAALNALLGIKEEYHWWSFLF
jgi:hypothetical protein